jgi:hypothetical protein
MMAVFSSMVSDMNCVSEFITNFENGVVFFKKIT